MCEDIKSYPDYSSRLPIIEIGSYTGESAVLFAKYIPNLIVCVDTWLPGYDSLDIASFSDFDKVKEEFFCNTEGYNIKHYYSNEEALEEHKEFLFVYLDGCHEYKCVVEDIKFWKERTLIIGGHDFTEDPVHKHVYGVQKAVRELLGEPDKTYEDLSWLKFHKQ